MHQLKAIHATVAYCTHHNVLTHNSPPGIVFLSINSNQTGEIALKSRTYRMHSVTLILEDSTNQLLTESSKRSRRSRKQEAILRLTDHLKQFSAISGVGNAIAYPVEEEGSNGEE